MRVLNLYAGIGGNRKNWSGVEVTAVELNPDIAAEYAANFPGDELIVGDAHEFLRLKYGDFDFIWSSPPCVTHSRLEFIHGAKHADERYPDLTLYQEILFLTHRCKAQWVVENVEPYYQPLVPGKKIGRHIFWSNFHIGDFIHDRIDCLVSADRFQLEQWLGMTLRNNCYSNGSHNPLQPLRNCVHPDVGQYVLECARPRDLFSGEKGTC